MAPSAAYIIPMHAGSQTGKASKSQAFHRVAVLGDNGLSVRRSGACRRSSAPWFYLCYYNRSAAADRTHLPDCRVRAGRASSSDSEAFMTACSAARGWRGVGAG